MNSRVKYTKRSEGGEYEVSHDGKVLGTVRRREIRYNLTRVYLDRWWQVDGCEGFNDGALYRNGKHHFDTRTKAVQALIEYLGLEQEAKP